MTLDELVVKISADNKDILKKLDEVVKELQKTKSAADDTSDSLKDTGKSAETAASAAENKLGEALKRTVRQFASLRKIIAEVRQTMQDFQEENPNSPITQAIAEAKESWEELKEDLIMEAAPLIETVANAIVLINKSLKPTNQMIGGILKALEKSRILEIVLGVLDALTAMSNLPIDLINIGLEKLYGTTSKVKVGLKEIQVEIRDLSKYYNLLNKEVKRSLQLIAGFDELNIYQATSEEVDNQEQINDLAAYYNELKEDEQTIQGEINKLWQDYADELGITVGEYQELWDAYKSGDQEKFNDLVNKLGLNWDTALSSMNNFKNNAWPTLQDYYSKLEDIRKKLREVLDLIEQFGGSQKDTWDPAKTPQYGRRNKAQSRSTTTSSSSSEVVGIAEKSQWEQLGDWLDWANIGLYNMGVYADGGVFTSPTVGLFGEYSNAGRDPEIATPQSLMRDTMEQANGELASVIAQAASQVVTAINQQDLEVKIGDDVIAAAANRGNNKYYQRTGGTLR